MFKRNRGFTIFEMLVVMAIIAIIAILVLARYREGEKLYALQQATQRLTSDLRQAQGMAVAGAETPGYATIGGYGIKIQSATSYALFLNDASLAGTGCPSGNESILKTVDLPKEVTIDNVGSNVFFAPPKPNACLNGNAGNETVEFTLTRGTNTKKVTVTKYGKIDNP